MVGGSVSVESGATVLATSGDFSKQLKAGQRIRVNDVECSLSSSVAPNSSTLTLSAPFVGASMSDAALYKQDFEDAYKSAKQASEASASSSLKAEANFVMGAALMSLASTTAAATGGRYVLIIIIIIIILLFTSIHLSLSLSIYMYVMSIL